MSRLKVAMCQLGPKTGAIKSNVKMILEYIEKAKAEGAELAVFPEMTITGYCIADMIEDEDFLEQNRQALSELAKKIHGIAAVIGYIDYDSSVKARWLSGEIQFSDTDT